MNFKEQAPISIYVKITELHDYAIRNHPDKSAVKSQTIILLMDILRKVLAKYEYEEQSNKALYTKMQIVRQMLEEHLEKKLPLLPVLAKSLALSESTLKRNFKQTFGAGIYEFYLRIKMERARELLIKNPLSVKEVAYKFGYEKTSSFIKMFRKIYTFTPGELKKKMISD